MKAWLNGRLVELGEAKVSLFDSGLQHGVGLFETMIAREGTVFALMEHLARLRESAAALRLSQGLRIGPLARAVESTLASNALEAARIRVTITGGDLMLAPGSSPKDGATHDPTIAIVAQSPTNYPSELFEAGVRVRIADGRVNPLDLFAGHKTLWYWPRLAELQVASSAGCAESLCFTTANTLASGAVSNVFLVRGDCLVTPLARGEGELSAVLPGITRARVMALAAEVGVSVAREGRLTIDDLLASDEVFLTNSSWGVLPVAHIEARAIGGGTVGPVTKRIRAAYEACVDRETMEGTADGDAPYHDE